MHLTNQLPLSIIDGGTKTGGSMSINDVKAVFDYWVATVRTSGKGIKPRLDDKRKRVIEKALKLYTVDELKLSIDGVLKSDFHMGDNARGKKYDSIELILRNSENIEKFAALADEPDVVVDAREQFLKEA